MWQSINGLIKGHQRV